VSHRNTRPDKEGSGLTDHSALAKITTRLATQDSGTLRKLVNLSLNATQGVLLEYPNIILATFMPILENLQATRQRRWRLNRSWRIGKDHNQTRDLRQRHSSQTCEFESQCYLRRAPRISQYHPSNFHAYLGKSARHAASKSTSIPLVGGTGSA
jgi:hypothetical protein